MKDIPVVPLKNKKPSRCTNAQILFYEELLQIASSPLSLHIKSTLSGQSLRNSFSESSLGYWKNPDAQAFLHKV